MKLSVLEKNLREKIDGNAHILIAHDQITLEVSPECALAALNTLKNDEVFQCDTLIDICGVDYLEYGVYEWDTENATSTGFSRGVEQNDSAEIKEKVAQRFAVVYHLLSTTLNHRLRVRVFLTEPHLCVDSVVDIWPAANWFEREAYDLFGILFKGHPDLRRILTDYGFIGYPGRKDFPLSGHVEVRYDATEGRVVYDKVDIEPRTLVPKVGRKKYSSPVPTEAKKVS